MPALTLVATTPAGTGLRLLTFDRALEGHDIPGQFVTITVPGHKPAFFALANGPGEPVTLLLRVHGEVAEHLGAAAPGTTFEASAPMGAGFGIPKGDKRPLMILATGSGISPIKPLVEAELRAGPTRPITLFYGVFTEAHVSFTEHLDAWSRAGVDVRVVLSEPSSTWTGPTGFVQDAARDAGLIRPSDTVVLCGFPAMVEEAKTLWTQAGAAADQLLTNY